MVMRSEPRVPSSYGTRRPPPSNPQSLPATECFFPRPHCWWCSSGCSLDFKCLCGTGSGTWSGTIGGMSVSVDGSTSAPVLVDGNVVQNVVGLGQEIGQINVSELRQNQVEAVRLIQFGDLLLELEVLEDLPRPGGEALDIVRQVLRGLVRVALELLKVQLAGAMEGVPGNLVKDGLRLLDLAA